VCRSLTPSGIRAPLDDLPDLLVEREPGDQRMPKPAYARPALVPLTSRRYAFVLVGMPQVLELDQFEAFVLEPVNVGEDTVRVMLRAIAERGATSTRSAWALLASAFGVEPAMFAADAIYTYLGCVVVDGEPAAQVFPPGESVILHAWATAATLMSLLPEGASTWQDHLQMIWDLETIDGVTYSALAAIHSRARRGEIRPISE
jgi:hypothetical protein